MRLPRADRAADKQLLAARELVSRGLVVGSAGNVSRRAGHAVRIMPTRLAYASMRRRDLVTVDVDGGCSLGHTSPRGAVDAPAAKLADGQPLDEDVLMCGDRQADKAIVSTLVRRIDGLQPVDAGRLEMAQSSSR